MGLDAGGEALRKFCNLYPHLCLEAVFPINTKLLPNKHFSLKAGNFSLLLSYATCCTERISSPFDKKCEGKETSKIPIFKHFSELEKIW